MSKKSTSKQTQNSTATNTLDPTQAGLLYGNVDAAKAAAASMTPFAGQRVADFNPTQTNAQQTLLNVANSNVGGALLNVAGNTATSAAAYKPLSVTASPYTAAQTASPTAAPLVDRSTIQNVSSGPIGADAISNYMNPYTSDVVNTTNADLDRQRQIEQLNNAAQATKAHAFGGTGAAVLSGLTNDNFARQTASTDANLRQSGFNTALTAAQADAGRKLQADTSNQGVDLGLANTNANLGEFNASLLNTTNLANTAATNTASQFNAGQNLTGQVANQTAGLEANGQAITAAGLLGNLSNEQQTQAVTNAGLLGQVGDAQQAQQQNELNAALQAWKDGQNLTLAQQQLINQALSLIPAQQTITQTGSATGTQTKPLDLGSILSGVGSIVQGAAMF